MSGPIFVSHASEDKGAVVRPLVDALLARGHEVAYDEYTFRVGQSLVEAIDSAIHSAGAGVIVLSRSFFDKTWTTAEKNALVTRLVNDDLPIAPIWHGVSHQEVSEFSAILADRIAITTPGGNLDASQIADLCEKVVRNVIEHSTASGSGPTRVAPDQRHEAADCQLFQRFLILWPSNSPSSIFLRDHDLGGQFDWSVTFPLSMFRSDWDNAEHTFHDVELESLRQSLLAATSEFLLDLSVSSGPASNGLQSVPRPNQLYRSPEDTDNVRRLNESASALYKMHQSFVAAARKTLAL